MTAGVELVSAGPPQARRALAVRALVYAVALIVAVVALVGSSGAVAPAGLLSWSTAFDDGYAYLFTDLLARLLVACAVHVCIVKMKQPNAHAGALLCIASAERAY